MKKSDLKSYIRENIINILSEDLDEKEEQVDRINQKIENIPLEEEDDDKDAIKAAEKARGKYKKYDTVLDRFKKVETEMRSLGRDYSKASGVQKDNLLKKLKDLTKLKNELKQEVEKYAEKLV